MAEISELQERIMNSDNAFSKLFKVYNKERKATIPKIISDYKVNYNTELVERWGKNNMYPNILAEAIDSIPVLQAGIAKIIELIYGQGPYTYKKTLSANSQSTITEVMDLDYNKLLNNSRIAEYSIRAISDFKIHAHAFACLRVDNDKKIGRIEIIPATMCRYKKPNKKGFIDTMIVSPGWMNKQLNNQLLYGENAELKKNNAYLEIPILSSYDTLNDIKNKIEAGITAFIYPIVDYSSNAAPYAQNSLQACYNSGWMDIARLVPTLKSKSMDNSMSLKQVIYYNVDAFPDYFGVTNIIESSNSTNSVAKPGIDPETKKKALQKFQLEIYNKLTGVDGFDATMFVAQKTLQDGTIVKALEFEPLDKNTIDKAMIEDAMHSHSVLLESIGLDMSILGHGMPGTTMGGGASGSNKRVAMQVYQAGSKLTRDLIYQPFKISHEYNTGKTDVILGVKDLEIVPLNENPTGVNK